jgi:hypothetical protein
MSRTFQFSLLQLLWLPFWLAVLILLWQYIPVVDDTTKPLALRIVEMLIASATMFMVARLGATAQRPKTGATLGILAALIAVLCMAPTLN